MPIVTEAAVEVARLLMSNPTPEQIIAYHPASNVTERYYELIDTEREHPLAPEEQQELESYVALEYMLGLVKIEARKKLGQKVS